MRTTTVRFAVLLLGAVGMRPLSAQAETAAPTTATAGPLLVVKTSSATLARRLANAIAPGTALPDAPEDCRVLTMDGNRKLTVAAAPGTSFLDITADVAGLMGAFAAQIDGVRPMLRGTMTVAVQQQGLAAKDAVALVDSILAAPLQVGSLSIRIDRDPVSSDGFALDLSLTIEPRPGTTFATMVAALEPSPLGAPQLPAATDAIMTMRASLAPAALRSAFAPVLDFVLSVATKSDDGAQKLRSAIDKAMPLYDGSFASTVDARMRQEMLVGVTDSKAMAELFGSGELTQWMRSLGFDRSMEVEFDAKALEHRGVALAQTRVTSDLPNPVFVDGVLESWTGIAGQWMVAAASAERTKDLVDAALDQKVARQPLEGGAMLEVSMQLTALLAATGQQLPERVAAQMPEQIKVSLGRQERRLALTIHAR